MTLILCICLIITKFASKFIKTMERLTEIERCHLLLDTAQIGWYEAYFTPGHFVCSDYLMRLFGRKDKILTFKEFGFMIREDYRERITFEFAMVKVLDVYEQVFPIYTAYGIKWVRSKLCKRTIDEEGNVIALGMLEALSVQENDEKQMNERALINHLLTHFGSLSRALSSFVRMGDLKEAINKVLTEVLHSLDTRGRIYITQYDDERNMLHCPYEICSEGVVSLHKALNDISLDNLKWSMQMISKPRPLIINNLEELPVEAEEERKILAEEGIVSFMIIPMVMKEKVYGFMGIEIVDSPRLWSSDDYQWLSSIANMISICIELFVSEEKAQRERDNLDKTLVALDRSEKMLRNIYMNIPVGIELYDKNGILVDLNNKDVEIFGLPSKEAALGINIFQNPIIPPGIIAKLRDKQPVTFRLTYPFNRVGKYYDTLKEGSLDISTKVSMLYDAQGELINYMLINIDNTEQTIAYNRIEEFETFFTLISKFAKVGYAKFDLLSKHGTAVPQWYWNLGEEVGTPLEEIIGVYSSVHEEDAQGMKDFFEQVKRGEAYNIRKELRIRTANGWKWTRVNVMRVSAMDMPDKLEMICVNYDITELKENQLQREKAEELDRLKSAFLANMSHEIRTPLNAIVGFSSLLTETDSKEEQAQFMEIIEKNNELLLQLISDILDLSKIEAGTMEYKFTPIDIHSVLEELVTSFQIKMPEGVKIYYTPELPPYTLLCDRVRLIQVLSNFINNAIKYTTHGSIHLHYELQPDAVKFSVSDTGEGMPAEVQAHIFDRFYKGNAFKQGTGLGLSICETIVKRLGGEIGVNSVVGEGSEFWFTIPKEIKC